MKVCILTSVHPVFDTRIFQKEAKTLKEAGYEVILIAQHKKEEIVDGIKIIPLTKPQNRFWRVINGWQLLQKALRERADIYHFHDPELIPFVILLKVRTGAKIIYDIHEDYPKAILSKYWIPKIFRKIISIIFQFFEKLACKSFDYLIFAWPGIAKNFNNKKTITIRNFPIIKKPLPSKNSSSKSYFSIVYIGNISRENGLTQTIRALEYLKEDVPVRLQLIGWFAPPSYQRELSKLKGYKKIEYLGKVPFNQISSYLIQADAGIICALPEPNALESEPNKLFEYMIAGLPVIASNFPLWEEIVEKNNCGLTVNPLDSKEIANSIEYLIGHREEGKKMGENGKKLILKKYNWKEESKKLLKVYSELINKTNKIIC